MNFKKTHNRILRALLPGLFVFFLVCSPLLTAAPIAQAQAQGTPAAASAPPASVAGGDQAPPDAGDSTKISTTIGQFLGNLLLNIASIITWAGGMLLEYSMNKLIYGMGTLLESGSPLGNAIEGLWKTIRDICNLAFIFGFIYIGIRTILDHESSNTKRMLAQIIIAALLINFSLFFTKAIIDFSNIVAISIKNSMMSGSGTISAHLGNLLGISGIFDSPSTSRFPTLTSAGNIWFYFMGAIFLLVAGFVLAAGGILLIIRFVMLVFIMIFSPILFGATIFPQTQQYASDLWKKLISYSFFAPAYLLLLLFTMHILQAVTRVLNPGKASLSKGLTNEPGADSFSVILLFVIAIMFLIASLQISKKFSIAGADKALSVGNSLRKGAQGYIGRGALSVGGKYSVGSLATKLAEKQEDMRKSNSQSARLGAFALRATGVNAATKAVTGEKFGSSESYADVKKRDKEIDRARATNKQIDTTTAAVRAGAATGATDDHKIAMERALADSSGEQVLSMAKSFKKGSAEYNAFVGGLSSNQFENLMKTKVEDLGDDKKKEFRDARADTVRTKYNINPIDPATKSPTIHPGTIGKASAGDLDSLGFDVMKQHAGQLTAKQIEEMKGLTPTEKSVLKKSRETALTAELKPHGGTSTPGSAQALLTRVGNDTEISKLPASILMDLEVAIKLGTNALSKIIDNDSITPAERAIIKTTILTSLRKTPEVVAFFSTPRGGTF